jgi:hypothetical protein
MIERDPRHEVFAAALEELYRQYPMKQYKYERVRWRRRHDRDTAVRNAKNDCGLYMVDIFAHGVPGQHLEAVYKLIYG